MKLELVSVQALHSESTLEALTCWESMGVWGLNSVSFGDGDAKMVEIGGSGTEVVANGDGTVEGTSVIGPSADSP